MTACEYEIDGTDTDGTAWYLCLAHDCMAININMFEPAREAYDALDDVRDWRTGLELLASSMP